MKWRREKAYGAAFLVFSLLDALTTWVGVQRGFSEANPIVASRLSDPALFFGSFALFTTLGLLVIFASSYMSRFSRAFGYFPPLFILMRALPVFNNAYLLAGRNSAFLSLPAGFLILPLAKNSGKLLSSPTKS
ncbi:DUF5658 family protein [Thermococcus kodakarensis]|nr:DUF5658 family protein [Thermococcus kodakarensis]WCN29267.1 DUF5658 family protein [Thermococcus kodakarensis]WCN31562.1 DUF5658 family protein [Thermococcus kodakarensis]